MASAFGAVRRLALAPALSEVTFAHRGFPGAGSAGADRLEAIPQAVICGFEWGIGGSGSWELERRLELVDLEMRGFAYEGAVMASTILDVAGPRRGRRTRDLLTGPGRPHLLLGYIGIGFAMARLPRLLWRQVLPDLAGLPYHPTMSWLAVDGLGFDRAYFDTRRWVSDQQRPAPYPWQGAPSYFPRAFDQGIGRALWFIHGDLWSGVGLAATFAGAEPGADLGSLPKLAGGHRTDLAQGAVFAATARTAAGFVPEHSAAATLALTGIPVAEAAALAEEVAVTYEPAGGDRTTDTDGTGRSTPDGPPAYELWRARIRERFIGAPSHPTH